MGYAAKLGGSSSGVNLIDIPFELGLYVRGFTSSTGGYTEFIPTQGYKYIKMKQDNITGTAREYLTDGTSRVLGSVNVAVVFQLSDNSLYVQETGGKSQAWNHCYFGLYSKTVPT